MKRFFSLSAAAYCIIFLSGCGSREPQLLPEEVVRRAVIRSHTVESVSVSLSANFVTQSESSLSGSIVTQGVVRSGGRAWSADTSFIVESAEMLGAAQASGRLVLAAPGNGQVFLRPESMEGMLGEAVRRTLTGSLSGWWVVGEEQKVDVSTTPTPDPNVLSAYADAIVVTQNFGIQEGAGDDLYHYKVALKPEAIAILDPSADASTLSATGDLWIDAKTFVLARAVWDIDGLQSEYGTARLHVDVLFTDYDSSPQIRGPVGSAATLPLESIFAIFSAR